MDIKKIKELARVMKENDLTALEMAEGEVSLRLERKAGGIEPVQSAPAGVQAPFAPAPVDETRQEGTMVLSPTVGVFYAAPSPDSGPFVEVGGKVQKGDVLCIIEAMKLMNEIPAEMDGTIAEICVSDGQVVEYNQPLFRIV